MFNETRRPIAISTPPWRRRAGRYATRNGGRAIRTLRCVCWARPIKHWQARWLQAASLACLQATAVVRTARTRGVRSSAMCALPAWRCRRFAPKATSVGLRTEYCGHVQLQRALALMPIPDADTDEDWSPEKRNQPVCRTGGLRLANLWAKSAWCLRRAVWALRMVFDAPAMGGAPMPLQRVFRWPARQPY